MYYPVNEFPDQVIQKIALGIVCFAATNRNQLIGGDTGERIISEALGLPYRKVHTLSDVRSGNQRGWSIKVRYVNNPQTVDAVELKLSTRFPKESLASLPVEEIADAYLQLWRRLVEEEEAQYPDLRTLILLNEKSHRSFALYEYQTCYWATADYDWRWSSEEKTSIHGFPRGGGEKKFSIHLNDSRLYVREQIGHRQICLLRNHSEMNMLELAKMLGFNENSLTALPKYKSNLIPVRTQAISGMARIAEIIPKKPRSSEATLASLFEDAA